LKKGSEKTLFGETKNIHQVTITPTGWDGLKQLAAAAGCRSISDLLERLGRGESEVLGFLNYQDN
jgi:hypothetical protein